jgi:hypothetical protein
MMGIVDWIQLTQYTDHCRCSCDHDNKQSCYTKVWEMFDLLSDCHLFKKVPALWSKIFRKDASVQKILNLMLTTSGTKSKSRGHE